MPIENIKRYGSVATPNRLALKSPSVYLARINNVNPSWGMVLRSKQLNSTLIGCCLWAAAVTVANACRVSEILSITNDRVQPNGMAWTFGAKGSNGRLVYLGLTPAEASELRNAKGVFKVFPWGYQHVYRACLAYGFSSVLPNHKHKIITHAGRYRMVQEIAEKACEYVKGNVYHRSDVGTEALVQKRVEHMKEILN